MPNLGYEQFNSFLRKTHFKEAASTKNYAEMFLLVKKLRDGIIEHSKELNQKESKVYRYTNFGGVVGMLTDFGLLPQGWESKICKTFDKKDKEECNFDTYKHNALLNIFKKHPIISDRAFLSTSLSETATTGFGHCKFIITCKQGKVHAANISHLSKHPEQEEVLFVPTQGFKVTNVVFEPDQRLGYPPKFIVEMETV